MSTSLAPGAENVAYLAAWFAGSYLYHGLGITLGYHRLLTHKALRVPLWLKYVIVSGGYLCLMGSPIVWVGVHRLHHQKSDAVGDPHSPSEGFMHALCGWMFHMYDYQSDEELQRAAHDLMEDPVFRIFGYKHTPFQAQLCLAVNIVFRALLVLAFGWGPMLMNLSAMLIVFTSTQCVNAVCHLKTAGYRLFDTREDSRNVWWVAVLSLGEGWHNNHHAMPKSARHGLAWWEIDVTWISIAILAKLGLAKDLILPPPERLPWNQKSAVAVTIPVESSAVAPSVVSATAQTPVSASKS